MQLYFDCFLKKNRNAFGLFFISLSDIMFYMTKYVFLKLSLAFFVFSCFLLMFIKFDFKCCQKIISCYRLSTYQVESQEFCSDGTELKGLLDICVFYDEQGSQKVDLFRWTMICRDGWLCEYDWCDQFLVDALRHRQRHYKRNKAPVSGP